MKKRILALLGLTSVALAASVISFSPKKADSVNAEGDFAVNGEGGIPIETPDSEYNPVFYAADYSSDIADEPHYQTQKELTFDHMGFNQAPNSYRGDSVKVAIIDSGINYNHEDFGLNLLNGKSGTIDNTTDPGVWKYYMVERNYQSLLNDTYGHGTNVASVVASQINQVGCAGIAPNVDLYIFKVTDEDNLYQFKAINSALQYCIDNGINVVNMSFQAYEHDVSYSTGSMGATSGCSQALVSMLNSCYSNGITLVAAAGNYNTNEPSYPASNDHVISVGSFAFDEHDNLIKAGYSNTYGIDLVAPGEVYVATKGDSNAYKQNHGTSFSAPIVTAAIALYKQQNPSATPSQIEAALKASCDPISGNPTWAGSGKLNIDKFLRMDAPTSISITNPEEDEITIEQGDTLQIEYDVLPSDYDGEIEFVSDENIVSVSSTGLISADEIGVDIVTVRSKDYPDVHDEFYVNVVEPQASEDDKSLTIVENDFNSSYSTSANTIKNHTDGTIKYVNVADFNNGIQIKSEGTIYNSASLGKIKSIKLTQQGSSSYENLMVGFGDSMSEAQNASKVALSTTGVSGSNKPYFYIVNSSSYTRYAESIVITYADGQPATNYTVSFNSNGGSGSMDNQETTGSSYIVPTCAFTPPANKIFDQWALNNASGTKYSTGSTINNITENITLYATWKTGTSPTPDVDSYYSSITETSGSKLLAQLHDLSATKHTYYNSYSSDLNTSNFFKTDPYNSSNTVIRDFYTGAPVKNDCISAGNNGWNREHVWPKNLSNNLWGQSGAGSDIQHLRPTIAEINNTRGSLKFGELNNSGTAATSKDYNNQTVTGGYYDTNTFQPMPDKKGDVARILMYTYMHYNKPSNIDESAKKDSNYFGTLNFTHVMTAANEAAAKALLLTWNEADRVDDIERTRNNEAAKITGCRNPFIDNEAYAAAIWGNTPLTTKTLSSISLSGTHKTSFDVGDTFSYNGLVVTAHYSDNSEETVTPTSVSSPDMSTAGEKPITVSYTEGGVPKSATYTITVSAVPATYILLSQNSATLKIGGHVTLTATFNPTNTTVKTLTWTSSDDSIATVNNGLVTAVAPGIATITATTSNGKTDTCSITVSAPEVSDIAIETSPARVRFTAGSSSLNTFTITASITAEAGATVSWTSSNESVIRVVTGGGASSAAATTTEVTGYFETVGTGTSTITASAGDESETCEVKATLPVKSYQAEANTSSVAYTGSNTTVSCTIYEVYTDNSRDAVEDNYNLTTNASILGTNIASGTYDGKTVMAPVTVTNEGSKESITTSEDANKQAEAWAIYFINMTTTTSTCKASNDKDRLKGLKDVWGTLSSEYAAMAVLSKTAFCSSSASNKIKEALNHYQFIISKFNKDGVVLADFVGNIPASSSRSLLNTMFSVENTGLIVAVLSIVGIAAIAGFVLYRKRKTY